MHPFRLPGRGHPLFSFILSCDWELRNNTGSAKVLTPSQLSDTAFVQRTAFTKLRLLRATIWQQGNSVAASGANRNSDARAHCSGLRTHGCDRIAGAALQLSRALQK